MKNKMPCWPHVPRAPKQQRSLNYMLEWWNILTVVYVFFVFIFYSNESKEVSSGWTITVKMEPINCFLFIRQYLIPSFEIGAYLCTLCIWWCTNYYENSQMQMLTSSIVASFILIHIVVIVIIRSIILFSLIFYICASSHEENRKQNRSISLLCELHSTQFHINKVRPEKGNWEICWLTEDLV